MKVKNIEKVENEDVYNMQVKDHHNFSVNGGFIVHNCDALRGFCMMRQLPSVKIVNKPDDLDINNRIKRNTNDFMNATVTDDYINF